MHGDAQEIRDDVGNRFLVPDRTIQRLALHVRQNGLTHGPGDASDQQTPWVTPKADIVRNVCRRTPNVYRAGKAPLSPVLQKARFPELFAHRARTRSWSDSGIRRPQREGRARSYTPAPQPGASTSRAWSLPTVRPWICDLACAARSGPAPISSAS